MIHEEEEESDERNKKEKRSNKNKLAVGLRSVRFGSVIDKTETETDFRFGNWYLPKPISFGFIDYRNR